MIKHMILPILLLFSFSGCFFDKQNVITKIDLEKDLSKYYIEINNEKYEKIKNINKYSLDPGFYNIALIKYDDINKLTITRNQGVELVENSDVEIVFNNNQNNNVLYKYDDIVKDFSKSFVETNKLSGFWKLETDNKDKPNPLLLITVDGKSKILFNQLKINEIIDKKIEEISFFEINTILDFNNKTKLSLVDDVYIINQTIKDNCMEVEIPSISLSDSIEYSKEKFCKFK